MAATLPTTDDLLGAEQDGQLPTTDELLKEDSPLETLGKSALTSLGSMYAEGNAMPAFKAPPQELNEAQRALISNGPVGKIATAFGEGYKETFGEDPLGASDPDTTKAMQKLGLYNDYSAGQNNIAKSVFEGMVVPTADAMWREFMGWQGGAQSAVMEFGNQVGSPALGRDLALALEGFPMGGHIPHKAVPKGEMPEMLAKAKVNGVLDGEKVYFGMKEPTPEQAATMQATEARMPVGVMDEPVGPSANQLARQEKPEVFAEYDAAATRMDLLRSGIDNLKAERLAAAEATAPHIQDIETLKAKLEDANPRKKKIYQSKIDDLEAKNAEYIKEQTTGDSPEMAKLREGIQEFDLKRRDLAPQVSEAYRLAHEKMPETVEAIDTLAAEPESTIKSPWEQVAEKAIVDAQVEGRPIEEQKAAIMEDTKRQLMEAGRPEDEAIAGGQLVAEYYATRAERFGGKLGTAEALYNRESPVIRRGRERGEVRGGRQLFQGAGEEAGKYGLPGFYSKMYQSLGEKLNASGTPEQMKKQVDSFVKNGQFKKDELYWSGLNEYLDSLPKDQKVNKQELMDWLDKNKLEIREDVRSVNDDSKKGSFTEEDVYINDNGTRLDLEEEDPYLFGEEVEQQKTMFHEDHGDDPKEYYEKEGEPDSDPYLNIEENEDGTKTIEWNNEAIEEYAQERARDSLEDMADVVYDADVGNNAHNFKIHINDMNGEWRLVDEDTGRELDSGSGRSHRNLLQEARSALWEHLWNEDIIQGEERGEEGATTYSDYQLEGPKDDYTELLITLPQIPDTGVRQHGWSADEPVMMHTRFNSRKDADGKNVMFVEEVQSDWHQQGREKGYSDPVAADAINKTLSDLNYKIYEIQGHILKRGEHYYRLPEGTPESELRALRESANYENKGGELKPYEDSQLEDTINRSEKLNDDEVKAYRAELDEAVDKRDAANKEEERLRSGVAKAPFDDMNKYTELGMKRLIGWAIEHGFDRVAWTTGEQQAERYSSALQRDVKEIRISPEVVTDESGAVTGVKVDVRRSGGSSVSEFIAKQVNGQQDGDYVRLNEKQLGDVFGKGLAEDILARAKEASQRPEKDYSQELDAAVATEQKARDAYLEETSKGEEGNPILRRQLDRELLTARRALDDLLEKSGTKDQVISGLDIKISDKGMKEVYDKVLVNITNGIIKKFGAKVKPVKIDTDVTGVEIVNPEAIPTYADINRTVQAMGHKRDIELGIEAKNRADFFVEKQGLTRAEAEEKAASQMEMAASGGTFTYEDANKLYRATQLKNKLEKFVEKSDDNFKLTSEPDGIPGMNDRIKEVFSGLGKFAEGIRDDFGIESNEVPIHNDQWGFDITPEMRKSIGEKGQPLFQGARGKIKLATEDAKAVISLFKSANASTFVHETGHHWLEDLMQDAKHEHAPGDIINDASAIRKWLGVVEGEEIPTRAHEKFARGVERYLMEGVAPSKELVGVFAKFKDWLTKIYQTVQKLKAPISDDVRGVFDRMLAVKPEKIVIADEPHTVATLADIHAREAINTPPEQAGLARDRLRTEADQMVKLHAPEEYDGLNRATDEATGQPEPGQLPPEQAGGQPPPTAEEGIAPTPAPVGTGGGDAGTEGTGTRPEPVEPTGPTSRLGRADNGLVDKAGNIRLDNLNTPEDVNQVLREVAAENDMFMTERRGVISDAQALDLADALGMDAAKLNMRQIGQAFNAEQVIAARKLLIQSATTTRDAMAKAANGAEQDVMAYAAAKDRHLMIQAQVSGITAEAGRALRAFREIGGGADAKMLSQFLEENTGRTLNQLQAEAKKGMSLDTPQKVSKFLQDSQKPKFSDMMLEYWINSLLSGPMTHVKNIMGNALLAVNAVAETAIASQIGKGIEVVTGVKADRVELVEAKARFFGITQGAKDGLVVAAKVLRDEDTISGIHTVEQIKRKAIPGTAGKVIRMPSRFLAAEDEIFKAIGYRQEMNALAYRTASKEGLSGDAFNQRVADILMNPTEDMMSAAVKAAEYQTFTKSLGPTGRAIQNFANSHFMAKFLVPFIRTPTNIIKYAGERTPLAVFSEEVRNNLSGLNGPIARDTQLARMSLGTTIAVAVAAYAAEGVITGGGPTDPEERAMLRMTGWQPYSIKINGAYYSYQWAEPMATIMGISADMADVAWNIADTEDTEKAVKAGLKAISKSMMSKLSLRGVSDFIQMAANPDMYGERYIQNFVSSFVPNASAQAARSIDPVQREARDIVDSIRAKIPGSREKLLPRRDVWGEPMTSEGSVGPDIASPIFQSRVNLDPVNQRLMAIKYFPSRIDRKINGVELTPAQYDDLAKTAGKLAKIRLNAAIGTPGFASLPVFAQVRTVSNIMDVSRETARKIIMMKNPDIIRQATNNKVRAVTGVHK
ncbi:MAG: hypothetical protein WC100_01650 [Sterolibacterium sp.]